jgi:hypothetical protein
MAATFDRELRQLLRRAGVSLPTVSVVDHKKGV